MIGTGTARRLGTLVLLGLLGTACRAEEAPNEEEASVPTGDAVVDGVTNEELEQNAQPMSPEQAERMGIIDSTIRIDNPAATADTIRPLILESDSL